MVKLQNYQVKHIKIIQMNGIIIFIGDDNDSILALILAANFMDIKPLLELASAKIACKIRGTTTESIRKDFEIVDFNDDEKQQINKDREYLEKNL